MPRQREPNSDDHELMESLGLTPPDDVDTMILPGVDAGEDVSFHDFAGRVLRSTPKEFRNDN